MIDAEIITVDLFMNYEVHYYTDETDQVNVVEKHAH